MTDFRYKKPSLVELGGLKFEVEEARLTFVAQRGGSVMLQSTYLFHREGSEHLARSHSFDVESGEAIHLVVPVASSWEELVDGELVRVGEG
jgi:hypothetical protein